MNGTVAPPSRSSTAAATWLSRTPSSSAMRCWTPLRPGLTLDAGGVVVLVTPLSWRVGPTESPPTLPSADNSVGLTSRAHSVPEQRPELPGRQQVPHRHLTRIF